MSYESLISELENPEGRKARLIPTLKPSQKEERAVSILLAGFKIVPDFAQEILRQIGAPKGARINIECYTEVCFPEHNGDVNNRPDGLIVLTRGKTCWSALVEAKIGSNLLEKEQVERYLDLARSLGVDAVITISNQFAVLPTYHPVSVNKQKTRTVHLYHFSWISLMSAASILMKSKQVSDIEQAMVLDDIVNFLDNTESGVSSMSNMGSDWKPLCHEVQNGSTIYKSDVRIKSVVEHWQQLSKHVALDMGRMLHREVSIKVPRSFKGDPKLHFDSDVDSIVGTNILSSSLDIPDAASLLDIKTNIAERSITTSMTVDLPKDVQRPLTSLHWLKRQIPRANNNENLAIHIHWPGRAASTFSSLDGFLTKPESLLSEAANKLPTKAEISLVYRLGAKYSAGRAIVDDMSNVTKSFYDDIGQHLVKWQPKPPKVPKKEVASSADLDLSGSQL